MNMVSRASDWDILDLLNEYSLWGISSEGAKLLGIICAHWGEKYDMLPLTNETIENIKFIWSKDSCVTLKYPKKHKVLRDAINACYEQGLTDWNGKISKICGKCLGNGKYCIMGDECCHSWYCSDILNARSMKCSWCPTRKAAMTWFLVCKNKNFLVPDMVRLIGEYVWATRNDYEWISGSV